MSGAYREAAGVLEVVLSRKLGLRAAALAPHVKNKRKVLALVARTLEHQAPLERAVVSVPGAARKLEAAVPNRAMRLLMLFDLLLGAGKISGGGKAARAVKELKEPLAKILAPLAQAIKAKADANAAEADAAAATGPPRYVRVNTLRATVTEAKVELRRFLAASRRKARGGSGGGGDAGGGVGGGNIGDATDDDNECDEGGEGGEGGDAAARASGRVGSVWADPHVANLLACRPGRGVEFHSHPRVVDGSWILQDKARYLDLLLFLGRQLWRI